MTNVHTAMARGAVWSTALRLSERALGLVSTIILARILAPQDFGVVAMCMVVVGTLEAFTSLGFDVVLIQRQDSTKQHYDTAFTLNVILGAVVGALLVASAGLVAWFYSEPRLEPVMYVVGANFFVRSLENIRVIDFRKHFQFHLEAALRLSVKLVGLAVTIPMALEFRNYWALVIGMTATSASSVALGYLMRPYRPSLTLRAAREILNFSSWLVFNNVVFFFRAQVHNLFIGRLIGARALGTFNMANEIAMMSSSELIAPINRAVYPGYAKLGDDIPALRATFLDVFSLIAMLSIPAALGTVAIADDLVPVLLGSAWLEAIPLIKLIAVCGALNALNSNMTYVVLVLRRPGLSTRVAIADAVLIMPVMYVAITNFGVTGAGWSLVLTQAFVSVPMWWRTTCRLLDLTVVQLLARVWRPLFAALAMYAAVVSAQMAIGAASRPVAILVSVALGAFTYSTMLALLWRANGQPNGGEDIVVTFVRQRIARYLARPAL
jgi:O-antigen/teichoic acid export membrane protein